MLKLAEIFQNHMMLQCDKKVKIFGTAAAGENITAAIQSKSASSTADENGSFCITLPPLTASSAEILVVRSAAEEIALQDVAVGEIWIAGGQSNMEFWMRYEKHYAEEVAGSINPDLRFYDVPEAAFPEQRQCFDYSLVARWRKASPGELEQFSAVGYYFQKNLSKVLSVPVGIVGCNWGGTRSAAWMSRETAESVGSRWVEAYADSLAKMGISMEEYRKIQLTSPNNDCGTAIDGDFTKFFLPKTRTPEEIMSFFGQQEGMDPYLLLPHVQDREGVLYDSMVRTIAPFSVRGVLWYQGESDDTFPELYKEMLPAMISDWRALWGEELPFLIVQLPGFKRWLECYGRNYPIIRKAQQLTAETVPSVYLASISDCGEEFDIHPKNKKTVGKRLAMLAENHIYGMDILSDPPIPTGELLLSGNEIRIPFKNSGKGLTLSQPMGEELSVAMNGEPLKISASVQGDELILTALSPLKGEIRVAFACADWYLVHLVNSAGIPAVPFELCGTTK